MAGELNVAAEIAQLRGTMDTGFAKVEGQLALLVHSSETNKAELKELEGRVTALEERRIPWAMLAMMSGAVSAAGAVVGVFAK